MSSRLAQLAFVIRELGVRAGEVLSDGDDGLDTRIRIQNKWKRFALISPLHAQEGVEEVRDRTYEERITQRCV